MVSAVMVVFADDGLYQGVYPIVDRVRDTKILTTTSEVR